MKSLILIILVSLPMLAQAHTLWDVPVPRNSNDNVKEGPCGPQGVAANVKPAQANAANQFTEGATIDISWFETINHQGYFWVDLARTDADLLDYNPNDADPANNNRATVWRLSPAPPANFPDNNNMAGFRFEQQVTLPAGVTCDNCTMRLVQFMEGRAQPFYYSCADVRIVAANAPTPTPGDGQGSLGNDDLSSATQGTKTEFGGCGSIKGGGGPSGPTGLLFALLFMIPLGLVYAGKISPIAERR